MPTLAEIARSLRGISLLFKGDETGLSLFDFSSAGFWRSFLAFLLAAPIYALVGVAEFSLVTSAGPPDGFDSQRFVSAKVLGAALDWLTFPLLILVLARPLKLGPRVIAYIVVFNWSVVIASAMLAPPTLLYAAGLLYGGFALILTFVILAFVIRLRFLIARIALGADRVTSASLVVLELLLSLLLGEIVNRIAGI